MMIHFHNALVADGAVVHPSCLRSDALLANTGGGSDETAPGRYTWGSDNCLVIMKGHVEEEVVAEND